MHIKSLVIDGFKSYGKRVELNDFDPEFNAITGLNGTGKSNILDAICFTLGISAMTTIRASTMQDVIYKSGQAGVHTATVTITFDNRDKSRSAPHYTHNDEIVISREVGMGSKNTYRINGLTVPAKKIMDFFNSLQMNVNNPHFIIMQGRITKVLNMKPIEILSMIEEAAGTNMYESKKRSLEMTVGKKDSKLKEMRVVADEEIVPTMETIEKEKQMLEELNMVHGQLRILKEKLDSWNYVQLMKKVNKFTEELKKLNGVKQNKEEMIEQSKIKLKAMEEKIKKDEELLKTNGGNKLNVLKVKLEEKEKEKDNVQLQVNACNTNINIEVKKIKDLEKQINNSKKGYEAKKKEMEDFNEMNAGVEEENKKNTNDLDEIDKKIRSLNSGNIFGDEDNGSVQENINKYNLELQNQQTENQQCIIKIDGLKKKLNEHLTGVKEAQKTYNIQMAQLTAKEKEYEKVKDEYIRASEALNQHHNLKSSRDNLLREVRNLSSKTESFESNNPGLFFRYNDPRPNFDRRKVHGLICRLFTPIDFRFELALTTLAGGKLYFIVVEDDTVGKDILESNKFPNRVNFIPLSKIKSDSLDPRIISRAQQIGGADNVFPAMSLIKYDKKHLKAIQWVFGQAFICTTKGIAEKVCFDNRVNKHCFTLEGDHFNPSGSLTGGANTQRLILQSIAKQDEISLALQAKKAEYEKVDSSLQAIHNLSEKVALLKDRQISVQEELDKIRSDVHLGQPHQQVTEFNKINQQIAELEAKLAEGKANEKNLQKKIKDLENKMKNAENILKKQLSDAEKARKNILEKIKKNKTEYDKKKNNYNKLELEIKDLTSQMQEEENQLVELNVEKKQLEEKLLTLMSELKIADDKCKEASKEYEAQREIAMQNSDAIHNHKCMYKRLTEEMSTNEVNLAELSSEITKMNNGSLAAKEKFKDIDKRLPDEQKQMALKMDFINFKPGKIKYSIPYFLLQFGLFKNDGCFFIFKKQR